MKLDNIDITIINSLMQDGRKSFRQIAKETKVSTPTVESHFTRMKDIGLIKSIEPILDLSKIESQVHALVYLKVDSSYSMSIADSLSSLVEVKDVYMTTGEYNIAFKLNLDSVERLEEFVRQKISLIEGIKSLSYHIITRIIKEDHSMRITEGLSIKVKCDYCRNEIVGYAKVFNIGNKFERNFCCNSCLTLYKQKYKGRIESLSK
jgi:Lrp/AsnC family transcriptional regulator, regulator for asnA, asnC and gidA